MRKLHTYETVAVTTSEERVSRDRHVTDYIGICEIADRLHDSDANIWGVDVFIVRFTEDGEKLESAYTTRPPWDPD